MLYNIAADNFYRINFVADFLQAKCDFRGKTAVLRFWAPLADLGATYNDHLRLIGKRVEDFLLVLIIVKNAVSKIWTISCDIFETVWDRMPVTINH